MIFEPEKVQIYSNENDYECWIVLRLWFYRFVTATDNVINCEIKISIEIVMYLLNSTPIQKIQQNKKITVVQRTTEVTTDVLPLMFIHNNIQKVDKHWSCQRF